MDLGGGDVLVDEVNGMRSITLSLDEDGGMGNSSITPRSRDEPQFATQQPTADDSTDADDEDARAGAETDAAVAQKETAASDTASSTNDGIEAEKGCESSATPNDKADTAADKSVAATATADDTTAADDDDSNASQPALLAPPSTSPPPAGKKPTKNLENVPHGNVANWEVERLVEQRDSKGHVWFRVKWKEFNTMTWEDERNLHNCEQLIKEFREKAGLAQQEDEDGEENDEDGKEAEQANTTGRRGRKRKNVSSTTGGARKKAAGGRAAATARKGKAAEEQDEQLAEEVDEGNAEEAEPEGAGGDGDEEDDEPEYEVENIISHVVDDGVTFYEVKWKGYKKPTWEPETNLVGCDELLADYKKAHVKQQPKGKQQKRGRGRPKTVTAVRRKLQTRADEQDKAVLELAEEVEEKQTQTNGQGAGTKRRRKKADTVEEHEEDDGVMEAEEEKESAEEEKEFVEEKRHPRARNVASVTEEDMDELKDRSTSAAASRAARGTNGKSNKDVSEAEVGSEEKEGDVSKEYEVESILEMDDDPSGSSESLFLVKWKDWPHTASSWEPASNFQNRAVIDAFMRDRGFTTKVSAGGSEAGRSTKRSRGGASAMSNPRSRELVAV